MTLPLGEVRLSAIVEGLQGHLGQPGTRARDGRWRGRLRRLRAQRRFHARFVADGGLGGMLDRNMYLLGTQLLYFERYGKMFLADTPLLFDPGFFHPLIAEAGAASERHEDPAAAPRCDACGGARPPGAAFCPACGARLGGACSACGAELPSGASFCPRCGRSLGAPGGPAVSPPPRASAPPAALAGGRYRLERVLGEGGKKRVYAGHDTRLDRAVALALIKTDALDAAGLARVRREARAMGSVGDHPHIVTVYDVGDEAGQPYIVSQLMSGGDLAQVLAERRQLPVDEVVRIADQVCQALEHIHAGGVIHRDLKPANVWFARDGIVKLGDFGLAATLDRSRITESGVILGTVAYMPPEQALGRPPDPRSDLYALGAMLYEMLTGRPPFLGDDALAIISQHINTPPVAPSWHNGAVPRALERLVLRLLAKAPEERPSSAAEVRALLAAVAAGAAPAEEAGQDAQPNPLDRLAGGVFVGRDVELRELRAAVQNAGSGHGRLILLGGEPGIGKTRLAEETVTYARLHDAQVLWGRCDEAEGAPAFWPWVQAIRDHVLDRDAGALMSDMGSGAGAIAQLVSEVRDRLPGLAAPASLDPEQARFRLFDSVTTFLRNASRRQPIVLVLDDLHWADEPSLLLLLFLVRHMRDARLLVLGTYRDQGLSRGHPLTRVLAELSREELSVRVPLRGLDERDVARFIEMTAGVAPPPALVRVVFRETEGNPFFVAELVRLLASDGRLERAETARSWSVDIPQGIREVIGRRLDRLSEDCNRVLTIAAVIGRELGVDVLEQIADLPEERLIELLEEAVGARILSEAARPGRYTFAHALVRETLYEELSVAKRGRLHRRIATVIERTYADRLDAHLPELAYHWLQAAREGDLDKALDYALRAASRADALLAYEETVRICDAALRALDLMEEPDARRRCELLLALGDAQRKGGDIPGAKETLQRAADLAEAHGLAEPLARAALSFGAGIGGAVGVEFGVHDARVVRLLEKALAALGPRDSALRARVLAGLTLALAWSSAGRRVAVSEEAVAVARRVGDPGALAEALTGRHLALWGVGDIEERLAVATETVQLAEAAGSAEVELRARVHRIGALTELGRLDEAAREREACARAAERLQQPYYLWWAAVLRVNRPLFEGRFEEAEELARQALALGQRARDPNALQIFGAQVLALRWAQGRLEEIVDHIESLAGQYAATPAWRCALAFAYTELGREAAARAELERVAADDFGRIPVDVAWVSAVALAALACGALEDRGRAAVLYARLLPLADRVVIHPAGVLIGSTELFLGVLAATGARWDEAEGHFERAVTVNARLGGRPFVARARYHHAAMCLARGRAGDRARALDLVNAALGTAQELGMKALLDRALALKLRAQGVDPANASASIDAVVTLVQRERPDLRRHAAPDGTVTIMFTDIEGSTALTERLGDRRAQEVLRAHNALIREQVAAFGGFEVKSQGDGFMVAFGSARRAVLGALAIQRAMARLRAPDGGDAVRVRIGLHTGEALREADDFFGRNVIVSARIAGSARGGEILVSSLVKALTESAGDLRFGGRRELRLKGLEGTHAVYEVLPPAA
jgi:class 3 adenylate cyclase